MPTNYNFCNKLFHRCGIAGMRMLPDNFVPLTVTSPPYDGIHEFGGYPFNFKAMAKGGVVCWHVQEEIRNGSESGTSSEQRLYFRDVGFRLHHTMIIDTVGGHISSRVRYGASLQYLFVLSKGKPRTFNPICDIENKHAGKRSGFYQRRNAGSIRYRSTVTIKDKRVRGPVWRLNPGSHNTRDSETRQQPALMHEELARDLITSWSKEGDLVLDPMNGAGTTSKMALLSNRYYLGFEINREYDDLAVTRLEKTAHSVSNHNEREQIISKLGRRVENDGIESA
ncbi:MAG: site-specific DNA-methyltransferase [Planctomycetaceae bacterium]